MQNKTTPLEFNNIMNELIKHGMSPKQYDGIVQKMTKALTNNVNAFISKDSLEFTNHIRDVHGGEINTIEMFYPIISNILLCYIENMKEFDSYHNRKTPLTELVVSFSDLTGVGIELLGDICNYDSYFKKFIAYENTSVLEHNTPNRLYKEYHVEVSTELFNW